jgi:hypothetical protein
VNSTKICKCKVPDEYIEKYGAKFIMNDTLTHYPISLLAQYSNFDLTNATDDIFLKILRNIEDPGILGEMFSSAASFDPTFWPLHGAMERILSRKRIFIAKNEIQFDPTWGYTAYDKYDLASYLNGRCDWSNVTDAEYDLTLPTCTRGIVCNGQNLNDTLNFSNFLGKNETYTNKQMFDFIHPWNEELPYVYDSYAFDYCDNNTYPFK